MRFFANQVKKTGTKMVEIKVAASMPPKTPVPIEWRAAEPAPVARSIGVTPKMKASEVIKMGRSRSPAASIAASNGP